MLKTLEHIGIAVNSLERAVPLFEALLGSPSYKTEEVESEQVNTAFFNETVTKIELLEASGEGSVIQRFIDKKGEGIHHIAFRVDNIESEMNRLEALGFQILNKIPKKGADNKLVCFLHPKGTHGVLVELCQEI